MVKYTNKKLDIVQSERICSLGGRQRVNDYEQTILFEQ